MAAADGVFNPVDGSGVGAGHDERGFVFAGVAGGPDLLSMFFGSDDLLAVHMSAAFGPHLIFKKDAGGAGLFVFLLRPNNVESIAVTGILVADYRNIRRIADLFEGSRHFREGQESHVRLPEAGRGNGIAAHGEAGKPRGLRGFGGNRVINPRSDHEFAGGEIGTKIKAFLVSCSHKGSSE